MKSARCGEVWIVDLGMIAKVRPALILSTPFRDDERALYAAIPHTTSVRGGRFEINIPLRFLEAGAFDVQSLGPIRPNMLVRRLGFFPPEHMDRIHGVVKTWLELK